MLLCLSSRHSCSVFEEPVEAACEAALETAVCFASCLAFLRPSLDVGDRGGVWAFAGDEDHVQCAVEFAVAAAVEPAGAAPASGRQAETGLSAQTHHWKDTANSGQSQIESQTKSTDANLTNPQDGTPTHSQFTNDPRRAQFRGDC
jgi:hypothetical protein